MRATNDRLTISKKMGVKPITGYKEEKLGGGNDCRDRPVTLLCCFSTCHLLSWIFFKRVFFMCFTLILCKKFQKTKSHDNFGKPSSKILQ